ncbi:hypothetical protein J8L13_15445 [Bacteroides fragilis]|uniref:FimB/Mfa2 family fimbrial subunit n=1 Tax=Bacteroides fragilis TaxID=817 RepID=UPI00202E11B5|nr:FimB/Mfa2 family fimbrial subunit [Bacteroides fragilis]MCM0238784.1 hypothetical protein [Bacteroides fragilis]
MKLKKYLAGSLLALLSLTTACTDEQIVETGQGNGTGQPLPEGAVQFKIDGINTGAVESRATTGTVIATSQENRVDHLSIYIFGSEKEGATEDELTFREYWTSEKRADYVCDTEKKTFALKGMGKYYTATVVVPAELKTTYFMFVTNEPRQFNAQPLFTGLPATMTGTMTELTKLYKKGDEHIHTGYELEGWTARDSYYLAFSDAINGVGVPAAYGYTVPVTLPCDQPLFEMENDYSGFIPGQRETLSMVGWSRDAVTSDGQAMSVTLYRNVARLDVSVDGGIALKSLKLTNISATSAHAKDQYFMGFPFNYALPVTDVQSTFSLMKTNDAGELYVPARSYCYPSLMTNDDYAEVKLIGEQADGTAFSIPFVDKDTKQPLTIENNHRYTIKIRRSSDNSIDANIIVEAWNVGDVIDVDLNGGDDLTPAPALYDASNYEYAQWESTSKVTCMLSDNYTLNSTNPATYPWLRFDLRQMSSLGLRMYYRDSETDFPGAFFDPTMKVHGTVESADGTMVRHELMVTFPTVNTQWLKLQNNFDPSLNYVVKVETGNTEATSTNAKTPALIAFAETNVSDAGTALINFPSGGFDGPYCQPVADWSTYRGQAGANHALITVPGYAIPTEQQLQCIAPDAKWGRFDTYNGANVVKTIINNDLTVYYSGSPLDRNVVKAVVDRSQAGTDLGTAPQYVNVEATLWHYDARGYLRINMVNVSMPGTDAGRLTSYTALTDLFNNGQSVSAGYTRFFPAAAAETAYLGAGTSALVFGPDEVKYVAAYAGTGFIRPVMSNGVMQIPARTPVLIPERVINHPVETITDFGVTTGDFAATAWQNALDNVPAGYWKLPAKADINTMAHMQLTAIPVTVTDPDFLKVFPATVTRAGEGTASYWLADSYNDNEAWCLVRTGNQASVVSRPKTEDIGVRYIKYNTPEYAYGGGAPSIPVDLGTNADGMIRKPVYVAPVNANDNVQFKYANFATDGTGLCPAGWNVPTKEEAMSIFGLTDAEWPYDVSTDILNAWPAGTYWTRDRADATRGWSYKIGADGRVSVEKLNQETGARARCVKIKEQNPDKGEEIKR